MHYAAYFLEILRRLVSVGGREHGTGNVFRCRGGVRAGAAHPSIRDIQEQPEAGEGSLLVERELDFRRRPQEHMGAKGDSGQSRAEFA
jgi:hypothetical protein